MGVIRLDFNEIEENEEIRYIWTCPECGELNEEDCSVSDVELVSCAGCKGEFEHEVQ